MIETALGTFSFAKITTGTFVSIILAFIIFGGVKRIASFTQVVVPFMALAYIVIAFIIILLNIGMLPGIISMIVSDAFTPMAGMGAAIGWGVKRGVYSNEAGQGTGLMLQRLQTYNTRHNRGLCRHFPCTLIPCWSVQQRRL